MNIIVFHSEDDVRMCCINDKPEFDWCKKIPHVNNEPGMNLYAETVGDIHTLIKVVNKLKTSKDEKMTIIVLTSDMYLQIRQIRDVSKFENVIFLVLCDNAPTSYCDVAIGDGTVAFSSCVSQNLVKLDVLPLSVSAEFVKNSKIAILKKDVVNEEQNTLPDYIDAFTFFGNPTLTE